MNKQREKMRRATRTPTKMQVVLCVLLLIVIALLIVFVVIPSIKGSGLSSDFFDSRAQSGTLPGKTQEEIQAELDKIVEEGMFNVSISSIVTVKKGSDEALVRIENIAANHHNMKVTITLENGNEIIYQSEGLAPGQYIEYAKFNRKLTTGEYKATAVFTAYDIKDFTPVGQVAVKITIVVSQ